MFPIYDYLNLDQRKMPSSTTPEVPHYVPASPTTVDCRLRYPLLEIQRSLLPGNLVDYADLPIIDISKSSTPEGRAKLALQVRDAMVDHGFFYVINHGYATSQVVRFPQSINYLHLLY